MNRPALWSIGLAGSLLGNVALVALIAAALDPQPVTEQPAPSTKLDVQAQVLPRVAAREQRPDSPAATEGDQKGADLPSSSVPQSLARAGTITPDRTPTLSAPAQLLPTIVNEAEPLRSKTPSSEAAMSVPPDTALLSAQQVQSLSARAEPLRPDSTPASALLPVPAAQLSPVVQNLPDQVAPVATLAAGNAIGVVTPAVAQTGERLTATQNAARPARPAPIAAADLHPMAPTAQIAYPVTVAALSKTNIATSPSPTPAPALVKTGQPAMILPPEPELAGEISPNAEPLTQSDANAQRLRADLAFSNVAGDVDPLSLAAFQSFMQPGDLSPGKDPLRDGVSDLLAQVPCSRLQVGFDPDSATLMVNGHIPEDGLRAPVLAALQAQMGSSITVSDNILILPRPQCGALSGIGAVGLAQSTDRFTNPRVIGHDTHVKVERFVAGELLSFDLTAPDYDAYVYVDYFDAGGNVLHLAPNDQVPLTRAAAKTRFAIGVKTPQEQGLQLVIGPPFGQEIAVAFASSVPLYEGLRPIVEPAAPYLDWLTERVAQARAQTPDFKGEWIYFFIATAPQ